MEERGGGPIASLRSFVARPRVLQSLGVAILIVVTTGVGFWLWADRAPSAPAYTTTKARRGTLRVTTPAIGNVASDRTWLVTPTVGGVVDHVAVKVGARVSQGQTLFSIANPDLDVAVDRAEVALAGSREVARQARLDREQAQSDFYAAENKHAADPAGTPELALKQARQKLRSAAVAVRAAEVEIEAADVACDRAIAAADARTVTAPADGVVTALSVTAGQPISAGGSGSNTYASAGTSGGSASSASGAGEGSGSGSSATGEGSSSSSSGGSSVGAVTIAGMGTLVVRVQINEVDLPKIALGQPVTLSFDALPGVAATGTVTALDTIGTSTQGVVAYTGQVTITRPAPTIRPGMTVSAAIITASRSAVVMVPIAAVRRTDTGPRFVLVLQDGSTTPRSVSVDVGLVNDTSVEITTGLKGGETVITGVSTAPKATAASGSGLGILSTGAETGGGPPPGRGGGGGEN